MEIIPAIDVIDGKCVRLTQGDYDACKVYSEHPVDVAKRFEAVGFRRLHVVDLDGAKSAGMVNIRVLEEICSGTSLSVDFGGGIRTDADMERVFNAGASFACIGSVALTERERTAAWLEKFGKERIIIGADVKGGYICINGWKKVTDTTIFDFLDDYGTTIKYLLCTDVSKDGMLAGTAQELYRSIRERYPLIRLIASGGVGSIEDLEQLGTAGMEEVVVGKAIYEQRIGIEELMHFNRR